MKTHWRLALLLVLTIVLVFVSIQRKTSYMESVNVSMTTTPMRISNIQPVIDSILNQTVPPYKIYMHIPHVFKREEMPYEIPDFILNNDKIVVNRCEDMGPITKILPIVDVLEDPDTLFVSVDDDIVYHSTMIETLLENYRKRGGDCVITGTTHFEDIESPITQVSGYSGVLYKKKFLDDFDMSVIEISDCKYVDDITLSHHLNNKSIPIYATDKEHSYRSKLTFTDLSDNSDALYRGANGKLLDNGSRNEKCSMILSNK